MHKVQANDIEADLEELNELEKRLAQVSIRMRQRAQRDEGITDPEVDPEDLRKWLLAHLVLGGLREVMRGLKENLETWFN